MNNILIVAYFFPPYSQVGSFRITKLVKYFKKFGWNITVITVDDIYYDKNDTNKHMLSDISNDVKVIKTKRIKKKLFIREEGVYWIKDLYITLKKELKSKKYNYVFYTAGPFLHLPIATIIKKISKVPYIIDYRDPWLLGSYVKSKKFKKIASLLEPKLIKNAEYVINVTEPATKMYRDFYNQYSNKFITVENGYDKDDFKDITAIRDKNYDTLIVYSGKLGGFRNIIPFLNSLRNFNKFNEKKMYFMHIGKEEEIITEYINQNKDINKYIILKGFLPYKKALQYIKGSDLCLIIGGGHPYEPTTKIYDYIALNKPILCINDIEYGYLYDTLKNYNCTEYVRNNTFDITSSIEKLNRKICYDNKKNNSLKYTRENIFRNLSNMLLNNK
ncbi:MAG: hypothetical protein E6638_11470 [Clostridium perfringens]|nr:hypothetical protein [Clostridium perfringens]MDU6175737.1 hypothetical protein [Clostridium perfringens]